jgi:pyruvate dehydrogenase E1 component alpha subunit
MLEIVTYRHRGHSMSDPAKYRPAGELEQRKQESDPLKITERRLREDFGVTDADLEALTASVEAECEDAVAFAEQSPVPDPADLYRYTYAPQTTGMGVGAEAPTFAIPALRDQKEG